MQKSSHDPNVIPAPTCSPPRRRSIKGVRICRAAATAEEERTWSHQPKAMTFCGEAMGVVMPPMLLLRADADATAALDQEWMWTAGGGEGCANLNAMPSSSALA
jgi:hypothetical protein